MSRKYSKVNKWTLNLAGSGNRIAVIRASGSISRKEGGGLGGGGDGIASDTFIEKIRLVRGMRAFTVPYPSPAMSVFVNQCSLIAYVQTLSIPGGLLVLYNSEDSAQIKTNSINKLTRIKDEIIVYFKMIMISFGFHAIRSLD